ncbi:MULTISPECIES: C39 family peptidase [Anaerotignum]|uniref:C39 family peptidase n=1 Tax=Anaerotignum TaxID=2039240 RepID=UPI00210CBC50|nr:MULTISPECIES: C39 family peptidase [Anaerotignum]MCQ4935561.1 C39 family peptidase [Anaerotignum propionicum]
MLKKRFLTGTLTVVMIASMGTMAFANDLKAIESKSKIDTSALSVSGDAGQISKSALSEADIQAILNGKSNKVSSRSSIQDNSLIDKLSVLSQSKVARSASSGGALGVKVFTQEEEYYCGPATVKQTLHYINGYSSSQKSIANAIGTTPAGSNLEPMVEYINDNKDYGSTYVIISQPSKSKILRMVEYAVDHETPVVCRLRFKRTGSWEYKTNGHFLNANGFNSYGDEILLTDPNIKNVRPSAGGSYWVTLNELYNATNDHFAQEMAY